LDSKQTIPSPLGHLAEIGEAVALAASPFFYYNLKAKVMLKAFIAFYFRQDAYRFLGQRFFLAPARRFFRRSISARL